MLILFGCIALKTRRIQLGVELFTKAIRLNPSVAGAHNYLGFALTTLKRYDEALASYDKAIELKSDYVEVYYDRAIALSDLKRFEEALASYDMAIALKPDFVEAHNNRGNVLYALKRPEEALASYNKAIAFKPDYVEAYNNRGSVLTHLKQFEKALVNYEQAIALNSGYVEAYKNRGATFACLRRFEEALADYDKAIALNDEFAEAHNNRAATLNELKRSAEALASYNRAIALMPDYEFLYGDWLKTKMMICDWSNLESKVVQLANKIEHAEKVSPPFLLLAITNSPALQKRAAEIAVLAKYPAIKGLSAIPNHSRRRKIGIGYFSADFHDHATSYLAAGIFENHDRSRFEVTAFSFGPDGSDEMRQRLRAAFDRFVDVRGQSDKDVAMLARTFEIDIAVDLKGFTLDARTGIFAFRAAPIQVNYLGYPGTMGADYIDYLIADRTVIPVSDQKYFSEKIVYLPNSYQANDRKRRIADKTFTRAEVGLPEHAFVFCCFNNNFKITPGLFDCWMRILKQVDGSVLWLLEDNPSAASNLKKEAGARGVNSERLVFAKRMSLPDHLARHRLADLFLDTLPCNAHTTASDALWAGLPVLTQIGETFAGRVAASLLTAIGMPELITSTTQGYEALAIELATSPDKLAAIKQKLASNRLKTPLFDTELFTQHIEAAYTAMYQRYQADLPPDHIYVPA